MGPTSKQRRNRTNRYISLIFVHFILLLKNLSNQYLLSNKYLIHIYIFAGYIIEKRGFGRNAKWSKIVTLDASTTTYCIENLKESEFLFRVFAENSIGLSLPASSEPVTLKSHASKNLFRTKLTAIYR